MNIFIRYINYLKNNPEGYWFKRKLYGWGWTPAKPQGWLVIALYLLALFILLARIDEQMSDAAALREVLFPLLGLTALLFVICYYKGESPRWQWGSRDGLDK